MRAQDSELLSQRSSARDRCASDSNDAALVCSQWSSCRNSVTRDSSLATSLRSREASAPSASGQPRSAVFRCSVASRCRRATSNLSVFVCSLATSSRSSRLQASSRCKSSRMEASATTSPSSAAFAPEASNSASLRRSTKTSSCSCRQRASESAALRASASASRRPAAISSRRRSTSNGEVAAVPDAERCSNSQDRARSRRKSSRSSWQLASNLAVCWRLASASRRYDDTSSLSLARVVSKRSFSSSATTCASQVAFRDASRSAASKSRLAASKRSTSITRSSR
mmetsp:Transcript_29048/g.83369  ORF Transcript_29048/g.83369 Transcript_29048/m.83369 type:complete len:284 (+) Transcript_29048:831-1682(+)